MFETPKSPTITKQVGSFLLGDDRANYLKGVAEDIAKDTQAVKLQEQVEDFKKTCLEAKFDIDFIYCNKTGRRIGTRDRSEIELLCLVENKLDETPENSGEYIELTNGCSPAWLNTDSNHLQALMKCDPCGYVMYILGYAARNSFKRLRQTDNKMHSTAAPDMATSSKINQSLVIGFAELQRQPLQRVVETAEMLQRFFTVYNPREVKWPMRMPHHYCTAEGLNELFDNMEQQISKVVLERNLFSRTITNIRIVDAIKKAGGTGGASNIVGQGKKRGNLAMDQVADLFTSMMLSFVKIEPVKVTHDKHEHEKLVQKIRIAQKENYKKAKAKANAGNTIHTLDSTAKFSFTAKAT